MRDYSKVSPQFWIGKTGKSLRGNPAAQVLAMYLMTSPHANMIGVFHCPILYMAHETGLTFEGASEALESLIVAGFCTYEADSEVVFVHRMAAHQVGESLNPKDNQVKGVQKYYENMAPPLIKQAFYAIYSVAFCLPDQPKTQLKTQAPSKPLASQEQEQEQEQEIDTPKPPAKTPGAGERFERFWQAYPKKVGKDAARKAFDKRKPDDGLLTAMLSTVAVQRSSVEWAKDGGQYIPNPATWLNQGRWQDEVATGDDSSEMPDWMRGAI